MSSESEYQEEIIQATKASQIFKELKDITSKLKDIMSKLKDIMSK